MSQNALIWPTIFLCLGFLLLVCEVFIPSGGLIGVLALAFLGLCLWNAFGASTTVGLIYLFTIGLLLPFALGFAMYMWPKTPIGRRMILAPPEPEETQPEDDGHRLDRFVGQIGRTLTPLRPAGSVEFEGRRMDAVAEEGLVPTGTFVQAVGIRSGQLVVRVTTERQLKNLLETEDPFGPDWDDQTSARA
jgi:membrane-bound ClpP family serine protease